MKLESLIASIVRQHRKKTGLWSNYIILSPKQASFLNSLIGDKIRFFNSRKGENCWTEGNWMMHGCVTDRYQLFHRGKKIKVQPINVKSHSVTHLKDGKLINIWQNTEGCSYLVLDWKIPNYLQILNTTPQVQINSTTK